MSFKRNKYSDVHWRNLNSIIYTRSLTMQYFLFLNKNKLLSYTEKSDVFFIFLSYLNIIN